MNKLMDSGMSSSEIIEITEVLAKKLHFKVNDDIKPLVTRLNGKIVYVEPSQIFPDKAQIEITGEKQFTIKISMLTFPLQEKYFIAHEIGHYVLHSEFGEKKICGANSYFNINEKAEFEAHLFASAFLMPIDEISKLESKKANDVAIHFQVPLDVASSWLEYIQEVKT